MIWHLFRIQLKRHWMMYELVWRCIIEYGHIVLEKELNRQSEKSEREKEKK